MSRSSKQTKSTRTDGPARAVLYLRVSTTSQVKTDYDPEGISLPAQRLACQQKAEKLGNVVIVDEYVEAGKTATSMNARTSFQAMLRRIKQERDVDMVIVYKLPRMNRNRTDDALVMADLRKRNVTLISATENIDDTPVGQLMHGILAAYNEFRSAEEGADIAYKMGEKAKQGGTIGRAPLGYLNVIDRFDGREVRTVALDPERAPLIKQGFELYAEGTYTLEALSDELFDRGLRTKPGRHPATQVKKAKLSKLLRDPYYIGRITYQGQQYPGRHEPLIDQALFDRVQDVLAARKTKGERVRMHEHPIKGLAWCGACHDAGVERRMIFQRAKGNGGVYNYFFCTGRPEHQCEEPYLNVEHVDAAIADYYASIKFEERFVQSLRRMMYETLADDQQADRLLHQQIQAQLDRLDTQESNLIDLVADGLAAKQKVQSKLFEIEQERTRLNGRLAGVGNEIETGVQLLEAVLALLGQADEMYLRATDSGRKRINQAMFEKIYIHRREVTDAELKFPMNEIIEASSAFRTFERRSPQKRKKPGGVRSNSNRASTTERVSLVQVLEDGGSSKALLVGVGRFELPASTSRTWRATKLRYPPV